MDRKRYGKLIPLALMYVSLCLLFLLFSHPSWAAPLPQGAQDQDDGQEYIVQAGDSLYKISGQFYGQPEAYTVIVEATNAKAATDDRFTPITDPRRIFVGQRLWIPNSPEQPMIAPSAATTRQANPSVHFVRPLDGATVPPTFTVVMTATDLVIEPAGEIHEGAGHFHILIDTDFVPAGEVIINDEQHRHFGKGQYTTTLGLQPGVHVLRLQFADGAHIAQEGAAYQDMITVTVRADATAVAPTAGVATEAPTSSEPSVRFITPRDGATVPAKFTVEMAATGLTVEPAGDIHQAAGHFHILVDTPFVEAGEVIINDQQHLHFGKGQSTTTLELTPGQHVLRLQFANGAHIALAGDAYRDEITVTVK